MENSNQDANSNQDIAQKEEVEKSNIPKPDIDLKKWLYSFSIKSASGQDNKFYILKPTRSSKQKGEIEYAKQLGFFVKNGLLPKAAWSTILDNLGGTVSENDAKNYEKNRNLFIEKSIELNKINQKSELSEEDKLNITKLESEIGAAQMEMQAFELEQIYIFENTAEAKARNATIQWWMTELAYKNENEKFFQGNTFEEQMDWYDTLNDKNPDDEIKLKAGQKFSYLITMWFLNRINSWEEFYKIDIGTAQNSKDA